jgi:hypothetical protein
VRENCRVRRRDRYYEPLCTTLNGRNAQNSVIPAKAGTYSLRQSHFLTYCFCYENMGSRFRGNDNYSVVQRSLKRNESRSSLFRPKAFSARRTRCRSIEAANEKARPGSRLHFGNGLSKVAVSGMAHDHGLNGAMPITFAVFASMITAMSFARALSPW